MTPTTDELRALAERLESPAFWQRECPVDNTRFSNAPKESAAALRQWIAERTTDNDRSLVDQLTGALRFIIAFYEPGQKHLDTEAWKHAESTSESRQSCWKG